MIIFPAIDLFKGQAVRLYKGDYAQKTVYGAPLGFAEDFVKCGATHIHVVDLEGAKTGETPNFETVKQIKEKSGLFVEVGGGIRSAETVERYLNIGVDRVILGTAAVRDTEFLSRAVKEYGDKIAVGADVKDGFIAIKGWTESSGVKLSDFLTEMEKIGVKTVICTDVSKDGAMKGANVGLYERIAREFTIDVIASGGVSSTDDISRLKETGIYGAIIGKAYYTGAVSLKRAIEMAK